MSTEVGSIHVTIGARTHELEQGVARAQKKLEDLGSSLTKLGNSLTKTLTLPITAVGGTAIKMSIDFESAFAGVRKTVDATEEEFAGLREGILDMANRIPAAQTSIARVAEAAGQLGIQVPNIMGFTEVMINLGVATNMTAEDAATALARFANIVQMSQTDFDRLGSVVVDLGNNLATTEAEIVEMSLRVAGAGAQIGLTEAEIMSLSGALSSVGIRAEAGGSAISRVMISIASEVATGGEKLETLASIAGMVPEEFSRAFEQDAAGTIIRFVEGLGRIGGGAEKLQHALGDVEYVGEELAEALSGIGLDQNIFAILEDLGFHQIRVRDALLRMSGAGDVLRESIELGRTAWEENTALAEEAAERYRTTASQLEMALNRMKEIAITLGDELTPILLKAIEAMEPFVDLLRSGVEWFSNLDPAMQESVATFAALAAIIGPMAIGLGVIVSALGVLAGPAGWAALAAIGSAAGFAFWPQIEESLEGFEGLGPIVDSIKIALSPLLDILSTIWDIGKEIWDVAAEAHEAMSPIFEFGWAVFAATLEGAFTVVGGVLDIIIGLMKGDLPQVISGVETMFDGFTNTLTKILNTIIDVINLTIRAINQIRIEFPDWVPFLGGSTFGIDIPEIGHIRQASDGSVVQATSTPLTAEVMTAYQTPTTEDRIKAAQTMAEFYAGRIEETYLTGDEILRKELISQLQEANMHLENLGGEQVKFRVPSQFDNLLDILNSVGELPYSNAPFVAYGGRFGNNPLLQGKFESLVEMLGIEEGSDDYFRTAASAAVEHYWEEFAQDFPEVADKTLAELSPALQEMFIRRLGTIFAPYDPNFVPNVMALGRLTSFSEGGWTGWGPPGQIAGFVHGQEYVVPAKDARRGLEGILEHFGLKGYEDGGEVGNSSGIRPSPGIHPGRFSVDTTEWPDLPEKIIKVPPPGLDRLDSPEILGPYIGDLRRLGLMDETFQGIFDEPYGKWDLHVAEFHFEELMRARGIDPDPDAIRARINAKREMLKGRGSNFGPVDQSLDAILDGIDESLEHFFLLRFIPWEFPEEIQPGEFFRMNFVDMTKGIIDPIDGEMFRSSFLTEMALRHVDLTQGTPERLHDEGFLQDILERFEREVEALLSHPAGVVLAEIEALRAEAVAAVHQYFEDHLWSGDLPFGEFMAGALSEFLPEDIVLAGARDTKLQASWQFLDFLEYLAGEADYFRRYAGAEFDEEEWRLPLEEWMFLGIKDDETSAISNRYMDAIAETMAAGGDISGLLDNWRTDLRFSGLHQDIVMGLTAHLMAALEHGMFPKPEDIIDEALIASLGSRVLGAFWSDTGKIAYPVDFPHPSTVTHEEFHRSQWKWVGDELMAWFSLWERSVMEMMGFDSYSIYRGAWVEREAWEISDWIELLLKRVPNTHRLMADLVGYDIAEQFLKAYQYEFGEIPGFQSGGILPGYGGGDRRLALLEDGEAIIPKESVAKNPHLVRSLIPGYQAGGIIGGDGGQLYPGLNQAATELTSVANLVKQALSSFASGLGESGQLLARFVQTLRWDTSSGKLGFDMGSWIQMGAQALGWLLGGQGQQERREARVFDAPDPYVEGGLLAAKEQFERLEAMIPGLERAVDSAHRFVSHMAGQFWNPSQQHNAAESLRVATEELNDAMRKMGQFNFHALLAIDPQSIARSVESGFDMADMSRLGQSMKDVIRTALTRAWTMSEEIIGLQTNFGKMMDDLVMEYLESGVVGDLGPLRTVIAAIEERGEAFAEMLGELGLSADSASKALGNMSYNLPRGFRVEAVRFQATSGTPGYAPTTSSSLALSGRGSAAESKKEEVHHHIHFHGDVYGMDDFDRRVQHATEKANRRRGLVSTGNPMGRR